MLDTIMSHPQIAELSVLALGVGSLFCLCTAKRMEAENESWNVQADGTQVHPGLISALNVLTPILGFGALLIWALK